ncbi:MAG: SAM-dependent methyltransferase [Gammaproteobacteria bacterium CG_4_10_14_0_8_um_filter_38_16]|nr:MAG: SAM-dependent methyltransferase [Gammaproteobacteria bacterium CG_4_10_14_0_8_um_filter_38_16]PJA03559.1 MAG: SAM-dependent methyltransferase [Gammaproteobacteria bacterium CG_4_10_14_0_2_um_filter_38_22]PJB09944.1 MAG: SAM-dependent methyltransferase [Gammaproteobacteria bacterium CG_4_9_14_3_um_filter_38_9]
MNSKNSKQHWNEIYTKNLPEEVSWFQKEPAVSLEIIQRVGNKESRIIDVGGGASTLASCLLKKGYSHVAVLDISDKAIEYAKKKLANQSDKVEWYVDDITNFVSPHSYDIWHDRAVFHFLTDKESRALYVRTLKNTLNPGSFVIIASFAKDGPAKCSGLDIIQYDAASIQHELGNEFLLLENQLETHQTPKGNKQHFTYFLFQRR